MKCDLWALLSLVNDILYKSNTLLFPPPLSFILLPPLSSLSWPVLYFFFYSIYSCYIGPLREFELATYCSGNPSDKSAACHPVIILSRLWQPGLNVSLEIATIWNFHKYLQLRAALITRPSLTPKGPLVYIQFFSFDTSLCNYIYLKAQKVLIWWRSESNNQSFTDTLLLT